MSGTRYVLVHGGGTTGRFWDRLVPLLDGPALAVDLPGRAGKPADLATLTVDEESASVAADVERWATSGSLTVVAHSSGALVVPGVVDALAPRVEAVVLVAALVPPEGGCGVDCMKPRHRQGLLAARRAARDDGTVITLPPPPADPEPLRRAYGGDPLDDETLSFLVEPARWVQDTVNHYFQTVHWSGAAGLSLTYVLTQRDRPIPPSAQEEMAARLPPPVRMVRVDSGHLLPLTDPALLAGLVTSGHP